MHYIKMGIKTAVQVFDGVCQKYTPGHAVHAIQLSVRGKEHKIPATIKPHSPTTVTVTTGEGSLVLANHSVQNILDNLQIHKDASIEYSPTAALLFIQSNDGEGFVYYMSHQELDDCKARAIPSEGKKLPLNSVGKSIFKIQSSR